MHHRVLSWAAPALLACAAAQAQTGVTLSGVADAAVRRVETSTTSLTSLVSGSNSTSRLILRGQEDLGGGLVASFWLEGSFALDSGTFGTNGQFWDREATVRLAGRWGEFKMGRDWNPAFKAWASTDAFGVLGVGGATTMFSSAATPFSRAFGTGATTLSRLNNSLVYYLPKDLGGLYGHVMYAFGEKANNTGNFGYNGARLGYASGPLDVAAYYGNTKFDNRADRFRQVGVRGSYEFALARLSASVTDSRYADSKHRVAIFGLRVPVGPVGEVRLSHVRAMQSGSAANGSSIDGNDGRLWGVGYVHNLSKRTALYANAARVGNSGRATFAVSGAPGPIAAGSSSTGYEAGLRHSF